MTAPDWTDIDTVLIDLDGVLIDLHFDNQLWMRAVPKLYAQARGLPLKRAEQEVFDRYRAAENSINWYCIDHWSRDLKLDVQELMLELAPRVRLRPQAREFLERLRKSGRPAILLTNAHPESMEIKLQRTGIAPLLERVYSTHGPGLDRPKEAPGFWELFRDRHPFEPQRALLIDDNEDVLRNARAGGVGHLLTVRRPDSRRPPRENLEFPAIDSFAELPV